MSDYVSSRPDSTTQVQIDRTSVPADLFEIDDTTKFISLKDEWQFDANTNPGICAMCPIGADDISINYTTRVLTLTPPNGMFDFYVDGGGRVQKFRKIGPVVFPAFTNTSGIWYFHFDHEGTPTVTQTPWTDFDVVCTVYRLLWNATLTGAACSSVEALETHQNTISGIDHAWKHTVGTIWRYGGVCINNLTLAGTPNADGRNTVISLTSTTCIDDNLSYTVTNDSVVGSFKQNLGEMGAGSLNATNAGLFKVRFQTGTSLTNTLPATRFPFAWDAGSNRPQIINTSGTRVLVDNLNFFVYYVYVIQDPRNGEAIRVVSDPLQYTTFIAADQTSWVSIQSNYVTLNDGEIRPLYKLIFEYKQTWDAGCKYSVLRAVKDIRKQEVAQLALLSGSLPATSVTFVPTGNLVATNVQTALAELDTEKAALTGATFTGPVTATYYSFAVAGCSITQQEGVAVSVNTPYGNVLIGPQNADYCHFVTDRPTFYFNKYLTVNGDISKYNYVNSGYSTINGYNLLGKFNGYFSSAYLRTEDWVNIPGIDANGVTTNRMGFSYSNNCPSTGFLGTFCARTDGVAYGIQLNATYSDATQALSFRTNNGDASTWNAWRTIVHSGNIASQSVASATNATTAANLTGLSLAFAIDPNTAGVTGIHYFSGNSPIPGQSDGTLIQKSHEPSPTTWGSQIVQDYRTGRMYARGRSSGAWTPWLTIMTSGDTAPKAWEVVVIDEPAIRNPNVIYPNANPFKVRYDFVSVANTGTGGNFAGVMTFSPCAGTTGSTGDASYQLCFGSSAVSGGGYPQLRIRKGIDTTWNAWYSLITDVNMGSQRALSSTWLCRDEDTYHVKTNWTGTYWNLAGYAPDDNIHATCMVGYATSAGFASYASIPEETMATYSGSNSYTLPAMSVGAIRKFSVTFSNTHTFYTPAGGMYRVTAVTQSSPAITVGIVLGGVLLGNYAGVSVGYIERLS